MNDSGAYGPIWIIWACSCYYDHDVEFVHMSKLQAEAHAKRLRTGGADLRRHYEHPDSVVVWIEERDQTILG